MNYLSPLCRPLLHGAIGLINLGTWLYLCLAPRPTRITVVISEYGESEADDEEETHKPATPTGVDPTYVEWLNEVFKNSPESDTRMG